MSGPKPQHQGSRGRGARGDDDVSDMFWVVIKRFSPYVLTPPSSTSPPSKDYDGEVGDSDHGAASVIVVADWHCDGAGCRRVGKRYVILSYQGDPCIRTWHWYGMQS